MTLKVKVVDATEVPKMDTFGKSDPYVVLRLSSSENEWKTEYKDNTDKPSWNEEFEIPIQPKLDEILKVELWDKDVKKDDIISRVLLRVNKIPEDTVNDSIYTMHPISNPKKGGGKLHLIIEKKSAE